MDGGRAERESGAGEGVMDGEGRGLNQRRRRRSGVIGRGQRGRAGGVYAESRRESHHSLFLFPKVRRRKQEVAHHF